ncbi:AraC family transcriptional regulator [Flammeovirgaceae bacterium SG7u.111]|nr:AraC family transcriptional regulator [Flammeovirgaceae bacterium SG7u.132]WPO36245.1 AraC family transcriptional regulator [Flammeovirgaceae bacterium SG7u.111]
MEEPEIDRVHKHTFYEILWVDEGNSSQTIDYQTYELGMQSLFFISPGQVHVFEEWQPLKGGTILFTEDFFLLNQQNKDTLFELSFLDNVYTNPCLKLSSTEFGEVRRTIELLIKEKNRQEPSLQILQSLLKVLLHQIQRSIDTLSGGRIPKRQLILFKQFRQLVEEKFEQNVTASDYAEELNVTQHHLNRVVKEVTGKTATEIIRARSMLEVKRLLTFTDLTITEVSASLGYFDSSYFAKLFKKETGSSPKGFRNEMSEKYRN